MTGQDADQMRDAVLKAYGRIAIEEGGCGCGACGHDPQALALSIGYAQQDLLSAPEESNLGLGCGNPTAIASLKVGEVVLDLGSGAGFDCFLAARQVGPTGRVIGVDMVPQMVERARSLAEKHGIGNVEFRLGEIEHLPVDDTSVDVVISNCVINLSTDKPQVFREAYRVLRPGGRLAISDLALVKELPQRVRESVEAYVGCVGGGEPVENYRRIVEGAGFRNVRLTIQGSPVCINSDTRDPVARAILQCLDEDESIGDFVVSVYVEGLKDPS